MIIALWVHVALVVCYVPRLMFLEITHSKRKLFTYGRHFRNNGSCAVFNFHVESVSLLLEDQSSKTSSKADKSDKYFAFHGVILLLSRAGVTRAS